MGRVIWDHGYSVLIADVIVAPEYQGKGLGRKLMEAIMEYIRSLLKPGYRIMISLMAAEKYALFDMPSHGAFVASLREEVQEIIDDIKTKCFETNDLKDDFIAWIKSKFGAEPDYPWPDDAPYSFVFRCPNEKWFALVMRIKYRQLGLTGDENVWVVNMKAEQDNIPNLVNHKSIFPAWHMNKKHWITILLTAVTDFNKLCELTEKSYELVN